MLHTNILEKRELTDLSDAEIDVVSGGTDVLKIDFDLGKVDGSVGLDPNSGTVSGSLSTTSGNTTFTVEGSSDGSAKITVTVKF